MSFKKLVEEDLESKMDDSTQPIVFRPIQRPNTSVLGLRRAFLLNCAFTVLGIAVVCGIGFVLFIFGIWPFNSMNLSPSPVSSWSLTPSSCHVAFSDDPYGGRVWNGKVTEEIFLPRSWSQKTPHYHPDILNISLTAFPPFPTKTKILHLFFERLTVIRTNDRCYIRPMRSELFSAYQNKYLSNLNDGLKSRNLLEGEVTTESLYATKEEKPEVIQNTWIMLWCSGVPAFRLIPRPSPTPPPTPIVDWFPGAPAQSKDDLPDVGSGDQAVSYNDDSERDDDFEFSSEDITESSGESVRRGRSLILSDAKQVNPDDSTEGNQKTVSPSGCRVMEQLLEDFTLPLEESQSSAKVKVTRDVIIDC